MRTHKPSRAEADPPVLATKPGITLVAMILLRRGAMCPDCGGGTRYRSHNWATCKRCGKRVRRRGKP